MVKDDVPFNFRRRPNPLDQDEIRKVVVIGTVVAERLFAKGETWWASMFAKDVEMRRVSFYDKGNRARNSERVLMPLTTMQKMYGDASLLTTSGCVRQKASIWLRPGGRKSPSCSSDGMRLRRKTSAASLFSTWPSR
jgi:putative ABC transport system permease protein